VARREKSESQSERISDGHLIFRRAWIAAINELKHQTLLILATLFFLGGLTWKVVWPGRMHLYSLSAPGYVGLVFIYVILPLIVAVIWMIAYYDWRNERYEITEDDRLIIISQHGLIGEYSRREGTLRDFVWGSFTQISRWIPYGTLRIVVHWGEFKMKNVWRPARKLACIQRRAERARRGGYSEEDESILAQIGELE
jgi:hypothetical protein